MVLNKSKPDKHPWITEEERNLLIDDKKENNVLTIENTKSLSLSKILSYKQSWGVLLCRFFIEPIWWFFAGWMPIYLSSSFGLNIEEIGKTIVDFILNGSSWRYIGGNIYRRNNKAYFYRLWEESEV